MKNTKIKPIVVINFKTYKQGKDVINLAKAIESVDKNIIIGVQPSDIYIIKKNTKLKVYAQHVDYFDRGRNTGYILPEAVKSAGASGVFLNHSEHKIPLDIIEKSIERCKALGLKTLVFAKDTEEAKKVEIFNPDYIAVESPELVSGNISVSVARPELISDVSDGFDHHIFQENLPMVLHRVFLLPS